MKAEIVTVLLLVKELPRLSVTVSVTAMGHFRYKICVGLALNLFVRRQNPRPSYLSLHRKQ